MITSEEERYCAGCERLQPADQSSHQTSRQQSVAPSSVLTTRSTPNRSVVSYMSLPTHLLWTVLLILLLLIDKGLSAYTDSTPTFIPQGFKTFRDESNSGTNYYRYLHMDTTNNHLYVGAMDHLYRVNLLDISQVQNSVNIGPRPSDKTVCRNIRDNDQCSNHIRSVIIKDNTIEVCGTGAYTPRYDILNKNDLSIKNSSAYISGSGSCSPDPDSNTTFIYITDGNPGSVPAAYTAGTVLQLDDPVIYRPRLEDSNGAEASELIRTAPHARKWLHDPHFVGSFDVGQYVYFFFRESAIEYENCGNAVFSRVARICKNDKGGPTQGVLWYKWSTYLKARLNCSVSGGFPLYFDTMYDIKRIGDTFYGVFATNNVNGFYGSAVCAFTETDIETAFSGTFKEQLSTSSLWLPVGESRVPSQRPGQCIDNSKNLPDNVVQFIISRPLMDEAVSHNNAAALSPLYYSSGVVYNSLAVDTLNYDGQSCDVYFLGTTSGHIHKVVQWNDGGLSKNRLISIWKPFDNEVVTIWKMEIKNGQLYIATDISVIQIPVAQCHSYTQCKHCAHDPYCGWHKWDKVCTAHSQEAKNNIKMENPINVCDSNSCRKQATAIKQNVRIPGDPIYFHCDTHCPSDSVEWHRDGHPISIDSTKFFLSQDNGLLIFNITTGDKATYTCRDASSLVDLAIHELVMPDCGDDQSCLWQEEFRNWCSEFDSYKKQFNNWVCLKDACIDDGTCMPQAISDICPLSP